MDITNPIAPDTIKAPAMVVASSSENAPYAVIPIPAIITAVNILSFRCSPIDTSLFVRYFISIDHLLLEILPTQPRRAYGLY